MININDNIQKFITLILQNKIYKYLFFGSIIIILFLVIFLPIYFTIIKKSSSTNDNINDNTYLSSLVPTQETLICARTSKIVCKLMFIFPMVVLAGDFVLKLSGVNIFDSLFSGIKNEYGQDFTYNFPDLSLDNYMNHSNYILSIQVPETQLFANLLNKIKDKTLAQKFIDSFKCRGIIGIELNLKGDVTEQKVLQYILEFVNILKTIDKNFIIMYRFQANYLPIYSELLTQPTYDLLSLNFSSDYIPSCGLVKYIDYIFSNGQTDCPDINYLKNYVKDINPHKTLINLSLSNKPIIELNTFLEIRYIVSKYKPKGFIFDMGDFTNEIVNNFNALNLIEPITEERCITGQCNNIKQLTKCDFDPNSKCFVTTCGIGNGWSDYMCALCKNSDYYNSRTQPCSEYCSITPRPTCSSYFF